MTKDYAKRKRSTKKSNSRTPRKAQAAKKPMSPIIVFIGGMLITLLIIFLWVLMNKPALIKDVLPSKEKATATEKTAKSEQKAETKPAQKKSTEPQYTYHETLTNKEVEVDAKPNATVVSNKSYVMQCGAFKSLDDAQAMKAQIAFTGLQAEISTKDGWHRVRLGPYSSKRAAESAKHKMQDNNFQDCRIW